MDRAIFYFLGLVLLVTLGAIWQSGGYWIDEPFVIQNMTATEASAVQLTALSDSAERNLMFLTSVLFGVFVVAGLAVRRLGETRAVTLVTVILATLLLVLALTSGFFLYATRTQVMSFVQHGNLNFGSVAINTGRSAALVAACFVFSILLTMKAFVSARPAEADQGVEVQPEVAPPTPPVVEEMRLNVDLDAPSHTSSQAPNVIVKSNSEKAGTTDD